MYLSAWLVGANIGLKQPLMGRAGAWQASGEVTHLPASSPTGRKDRRTRTTWGHGPPPCGLPQTRPLPTETAYLSSGWLRCTRHVRRPQGTVPEGGLCALAPHALPQGLLHLLGPRHVCGCHVGAAAAQLPADDLCLGPAPLVPTHGALRPTKLDLHAALTAVSTSQSHGLCGGASGAEHRELVHGVLENALSRIFKNSKSNFRFPS